MSKYRFPLNLQLFAEAGDEIKGLQAELTKSFTNLKSVLDTQAEEIRKHGETSDTTAKSIKSFEESIVKLSADIKGVSDKATELEVKFNRPNFGQGGEIPKSAGQELVDSENYKNMVKAGAKNCEGVQIKTFFQQKDLTSAITGGGAGLLVTPLTLPDIIAEPMRQFTMRDVLNVRSISTNAIDYIVEGDFTNNAAFVAEKALKPESNLTFDTATASVKTLAHWMAATRQIIADASMLRSYVDSKLVYGLRQVEESAILYGSGTGENLLGIMNTAGVQDAGNLGTGTGAATMIDHIRNAITMAQISGYPVTGIIMHPADWAKIEMSKNSQGTYIFAQVQSVAGPRLWAVPIVVSQSIVEGEFLLGGFGLGAQLWDREEANVRVSEHHADFFIRNQLVILAEERLALTTYRPSAFVKGSLITT